MQLSNRICISLVFLLVLINGISAQSFYEIIGTSGNDYAKRVINDRDSGYVIVGATEGLGMGATDGYMVKLDTAGEIQWTRTFGGANVDWLTDVKLLPDGFITCGYSNSNDAAGYDIYLAKTDELGALVWETRIGGNEWEFAEDMTLLSDGSYLIAGRTTSPSGDFDAMMMNVSTTGDSLWSWQSGGMGDDSFNSVILNSSGQLIVAGTYGVSEANTDYWVSRYDETGSIEWEVFLGDTLNDEALDVVELIPGEFVVCGSDEVITGSNIDNVFYRMDTAGTIIFTNVLNNPNDEIGVSVTSYYGDSTFVLGSQTNSIGNSGFNAWVFECDFYTNGTNVLEYNVGGDEEDVLMDADTTFDKGQIMVGNTFDTQLGSAIFVHKTDTEANSIYTYTTQQDLKVENIDLNKENVLLYPNPCQGVFYFRESVVSNLTGEHYFIYDLTGALVQSGVISSTQIHVKLSSGLYLLQIKGLSNKLIIH